MDQPNDRQRAKAQLDQIFMDRLPTVRMATRSLEQSMGFDVDNIPLEHVDEEEEVMPTSDALNDVAGLQPQTVPQPQTTALVTQSNVDYPAIHQAIAQGHEQYPGSLEWELSFQVIRHLFPPRPALRESDRNKMMGPPGLPASVTRSSRVEPGCQASPMSRKRKSPFDDGSRGGKVPKISPGDGGRERGE